MGCEVLNMPTTGLKIVMKPIANFHSTLTLTLCVCVFFSAMACIIPPQ